MPWYIMTSPATHHHMVDHLANHRYFGLAEDQVSLFSQGRLPCLSEGRALLLAGWGQLALSPDGNGRDGGLFGAMEREGVVADMRSRGVKHVFVYCVDNILVRVADPVFLGFCIEAGAECGNKVNTVLYRTGL